MPRPLEIRPDDRVLLLGIPDHQQVVALSGQLTAGILVIMGDEQSVRAVRPRCAHLENVMLVPLDGAQLPWRDGFFTWVEDLAPGWPDPQAAAREMERVTEPRE
jgi:hypothetical protein